MLRAVATARAPRALRAEHAETECPGRLRQREVVGCKHIDRPSSIAPHQGGGQVDRVERAQRYGERLTSPANHGTLNGNEIDGFEPFVDELQP